MSDPLVPEIVKPKRKKPENFKRSPGTPAIYDPEARKARAELITEWRIKGMPRQDIASALNISKDRVDQIFKWGKEQGLVESVRSKMASQLLPNAFSIYEEILNAKPEDLARVVKAHELRLKAARQIAEGLGALGKNHTEVKQTQQLTLHGYQQIRRERLDALENDDRQRQISGAHESPAEDSVHEREVRGDVSDSPAAQVGVGYGTGSDSGSEERAERVVGEAGVAGADAERETD